MLEASAESTTTSSIMMSIAITKEIGMDQKMTTWANGYVEGQEALINELLNLIDTMSKDELSALLRRYL